MFQISSMLKYNTTLFLQMVRFLQIGRKKLDTLKTELTWYVGCMCIK